MDPLVWARQKKKAIAKEFICKLNYTSSAVPAGIFTAGLPGAGKTEFTKELLKDLNEIPIRIDMDEIASLIEDYSPVKADLFRGAATIILEKIYDEAIKAKLDFVFDGTLSHDKALDNVTRALEHGYTTKVYFIHQDPSIAWQFTRDRELVEHRSIDRDKFINTYFRLYKNIELLQESSKNVTISVIIKDNGNRVGERHEAVDNIYDIVPRPLARLQLEHVIVK